MGKGARSLHVVPLSVVYKLWHEKCRGLHFLLCNLQYYTIIFLLSNAYSATSLKSKFLNFWDYDVLC